MIRIYHSGLYRSFFLSVVALSIAASPLFGDANERQVTKLADGVYAIQHKNSNDGNVSGNTTVIIGDREVFVVDSGYLPSTAREDIAQIRKWTDKPVGFLLNTHFHNDHNNGNKRKVIHGQTGFATFFTDPSTFGSRDYFFQSGNAADTLHSP